jgi:hypothetical protein
MMGAELLTLEGDVSSSHNCNSSLMSFELFV